MRIGIVLVPLTLTALVHPGNATEAAATKTLAECIAIAVEQHPSLKAAGASVAAGHQRVWEAGSNYLPQIKASYAADKQNTSTANRLGVPSGNVSVPAQTPGATPGPSASNVGGTAQTFNFYKTGFILQQMLFDWGQTLNAIRSAQASERSLQADQSTQRDTVVLNVKQSYFNLLATRRLLAVADETVRQNQKHLEQAQGRYDVGLAAKFDVTQARVQLANAQLNQVTARNNVAVARETLRNALGLTGPLDFDIVDTFDIHAVEITEEQALAAAYDRRPELQSIRAQEVATTEQVAALQKNYLPNVTANGTYQWSGSTYPLQSSWDIGAAVNLSIFNGGLTTAQVAEQKANLANLKYNEDVQRQNIALEVRQDTLNLQQAVESIRVSAEALGQARENLELAEGRYKTGVGNIIELTDAQASLTSAEANHVQALYSYKTAVAALEKATAQQLTTE
jgi:outer membrane protein